MNSYNTLIKLIVVVFLLNLGDIVFTHYFLDISEEGNPIALWVWSNYGFESVILFKILINLGFSVIMVKYHEQKPINALIVTSIIAGVYAMVNFMLLQVGWEKFL